MVVALKNVVRALRLPFLAVSVPPFVLGNLLSPGRFSWTGFLPGVLAVVFTHLGANLVNDYADSKSGVDWQDTRYYAYFGGSKLVQERVFSLGFYLKGAVFCFLLGFSAVVFLAFKSNKPSIIILYFVVLFLAWFYSQPPLRLSYRGMGEAVIFLLFGPALVMGGYFTQTGILLSLKSFLLSCPFGFFTTAILFANEVPDFHQDRMMGKLTWVGFTGPERAYIIYGALIFLGCLFVILDVTREYLRIHWFLAVALFLPGVKAAQILKRSHARKDELLVSSRLSLTLHLLLSAILILGLRR